MRIINQSRLPTAEVIELVRFAFRGTADAGVVVKVKNSKHAYRGMAYQGIPSMSAEIHTAARQLVTIGIGPDSSFPISNMREVSRLVQKVNLPDFDPRSASNPFAEARKVVDLPDGAGYSGGVDFSDNIGAVVKIYRTERHPYGGKGSPEIVVNDWREALVAVAAHEARHVWQGQQKRRGKRQAMSEVDAERHAAKRLAEYRAKTACVSQED